MLRMQMIERPALAELRTRAAARVPTWLGESINGKTILVHARDAPTASLFGFRYVPHLASRGADVIIQVEREQVALLGRMGGVRLAIDHTAPTPPANYTVPFEALGTLSERDADLHLLVKAYLRADRSRVDYWQQRLATHASRNIECVLLSFGEPDSIRPHESIPLASLTPLFALPNIQWIVLERALANWERHALKQYSSVTTVATVDLDDLAGLIKAVDRVACIDSITGHLAGALGAPGWAL
ncbi:MAG: hypothetical protein ABIU95_06205, partial [Burkholderiales bacterium]